MVVTLNDVGFFNGETLFFMTTLIDVFNIMICVGLSLAYMQVD